MNKNNIDYKKLILKKSLAILLSSSIGFSLISDIGVNGTIISKIKNDKKEDNSSYSEEPDIDIWEDFDIIYDEEQIDLESEKEDITSKKEETTVNDKNETKKKEKQKETSVKNNAVEKEKVKISDNEENKKEDNDSTNSYIDEEKEELFTEEDKLYEYNVNSSLEKSYNTASDGCFSIQGACMANDSIVIARKRLDSDKTYLYKINKETYEVEKTVNSVSLGHCNDLTYNSDANLIFAVGLNNYNDVAVLNADTLEFIASSKTEHRYFALTYDPDSKFYVAFGGKNMYILNSFFEEVNSFKVPTNLTKQGIAVKDGLIYYLCWEKGIISKNQTSTDLKRANTNYIFVYDFNGNLKTTYYLPTFKGEGEALMFNDKGELLITVNGQSINDWMIYKVDLDKDNYISKNKVK